MEEYVDDFKSYKYFTAKYIKGTLTDDEFKKAVELYKNNSERSCQYIRTAISNQAFEKVMYLLYEIEEIIQDEEISCAIVARFAQIDKDNPRGIEDYPRLKQLVINFSSGLLSWD